MMQKKTIYQFPILPVDDIVANVVEMGGSLDEKSLLNPTYEVIWPLYESMAQYVLTLSREELQQPAFDKWCKLEYPEMHEESVGCFASWRTIQGLMFAAGCHDISLRDLIKPESSRTIKFLSGLINFAKFRKEREDQLADLQDEALAETRQMLEETTAQAKHEIASIEAERENQIPEVQRLEAENKELWQEIVVLNKKQSAFQNEIRVLKQELTSITDAIAGQNYMLQQAKQEESDLRGQIVESPEVLERALEETKATLASTEAGLEEARKNLQRWKQKLEAYTKAEKKVQKLLDLSEEAQKQLSMQKAASKEVKALKAKIKADEEEDKNRNAKLADLTLKGQHCQDLIDKAEQLSLEKSKEEERALHDAKTKYASFVKKQETVKAAIAKNKAQVQYLISKNDDVVKTKQEVIRNYRGEIAAIQQQVLEYYRSILSCTGPIPELSD
ncbi:unnamed protein product [Calypogeia fissa]